MTSQDTDRTEHVPNERGVLSAMFAVLAIFLVLIMSVLAEGGRKLSNLGRAEDLAAEVARAAAATLDLEEIAQGVAQVDVNAPGGEDASGRARVEADRIVNAIPEAELERFIVVDDSVFVQVRVTGTSFIPGFSIDGVGRHRALAFDPFG